MHLGFEVTRQEAEFLAGLDRRAHQDQASHRAGLERFHRGSDGQERLAGASWPHREQHVVLPQLM